MRKCIFTREIQYELQRHALDKNDEIVNKLLHALFDDPYKSTTQYLLKKNLNSLDDISGVLKAIQFPIDDELKMKFIGHVRSIFEMNGDEELPKTLATQLASKEKIAIFVGSGVSKLLGFPLWSELAEQAINFLWKEKIISHSEKEKLLAEPSSPKHKISVFHKLLDKTERKSKEFYKKTFEPKKDVEKNPYELLAKLDCLKISINYDKELWNALNRYQVAQAAKKSKKEENTECDTPELHDTGVTVDTPLKSNAVYQIHGSYETMEKYSIVTLSDYLQKYYLDRSLGPSEFLCNVFQNYVTIFIGCGLEEFEIIQHLMNGPSKMHHLLSPTYLNDENLLRMKREYFQDTLKINIHGYYLDHHGYDRLHDILESWVRKIPDEQSGILKKIVEAEGVEL